MDLRNVVAIATCLAVITMIASCEKEKEKEVDVKLLDTETSGFYMRKFFYDEQNRIKEMWTFSGGELVEKAILTYTGEDLTKLEYAYLDEGEFVVVDTRDYIKNGNTISWSIGVVIIDEEEEENSSFQNTLTLNNEGFPEKLEEVFFDAYWVSNFTCVNGNLTKLTHANNTGYDGTIETIERNYTYGKYRSAYSGCNTPKWFMFLSFKENASHNALTKCESKGITIFGKAEWSSTYKYDYDSDRFPTRCTEYSGNNHTTTEYKYKN